MVLRSAGLVVVPLAVWCLTTSVVYAGFHKDDEPVTCPTSVTPKDDFKLGQFSGEWYLYGARNTNPYQYSVWPTSCGKLYFTTKRGIDGRPLTFIYHANVTNQMYHYIKDLRKVQLKGVPLKNDGEFTYKSFVLENLQNAGKIGQFVLLETDYNCWAAFYECVFDLNIEYVGLLVRTYDWVCCNLDTKRQFSAILEQFNLEFGEIDELDHTDCVYPQLNPEDI